MKRIVLTGGGTAGHVTPNIALLPSLREHGYEISYIGSHDGIEKDLAKSNDLPYYGISCGKLRRYLDLKNLRDPFRIIKGFFEARKLLKKIKPDVIFSKGGFVSVPVVLAAKTRHIPVISHESDMTPGLANKISMPFAWKICCNFPETLKNLPPEKAVLSGSPIREELFTGDKEEGRKICGFNTDKPVLLVTGGSLGSAVLNEALRKILDPLLKEFQVVHLCGKGNLDASLNNIEGYKQIEYANTEMKDLFALSDLVISRAGANAICEILALNKPNILIPLSKNASRGDQILNARSFEKQGFSVVIEEEELTDEKLLNDIRTLFNNKASYINIMSSNDQLNAIDTIVGLIEEAVNK